MSNRKKLTLKDAYANNEKLKEQQMLKKLNHESEEEGSTSRKADIPPTSPIDLRFKNLEQLRRKRGFPADPIDLRLQRFPLKTRCFGPSKKDNKFTEIPEYLPVIKTDSCISKALTASDDEREAAFEILQSLIAEMKGSQERYPTTGCRINMDTLQKCGPNCLIPSGIPHEGDDTTNKLITPSKTRIGKPDELSSTDLVEPNVVWRCNSLPAFPTFKRRYDDDTPRTASCRALNEKLWHKLTVTNSFVSALADSYSRTKFEKEHMCRVPPADENGFIQYYSDFPDEEEDHETKMKKLEALDFMFLKKPSRKRKRESEDSSSREAKRSRNDFASFIPKIVRKIAEFTGLVDICSDRPEDHPPGFRARREYSDETMEERPLFSCAQQ